MATLRQQLGARLLHLYPFASGCGTLANHNIVQSILGRSNELVWANTAAGRVRCSLGDYVGRAAYYLGDLDPKVSWIVRQLVKPGHTVLDIGANIGLVTLLLAQCVGATGRVYAFEPNPAVAALLENSIDENDLSQVTLHACGLGSEAGQLTLSVPGHNAGAASFVRSGNGGRSVDVPVRTLTSIVGEHNLSKIDFIKMDVEGFEANVLRGATSVLQNIRPRAILFELNEPGVEAKESEALKLLQHTGYCFFSVPRSLFRIRLNRFDPAKDPSPMSHDVLAVPCEDYERTADLVC